MITFKTILPLFPGAWRWRGRTDHIYRSLSSTHWTRNRHKTDTSTALSSTTNSARKLPTTVGLHTALDPNAFQFQRHEYDPFDGFSAHSPYSQTSAQHSQTDKSVRRRRRLRLPAACPGRCHFDSKTEWVMQLYVILFEFPLLTQYLPSNQNHQNASSPQLGVWWALITHKLCIRW